MLRTVEHLFLLVSVFLTLSLVHIEFCEKHSILARSVFVLHGHRLCRDIVVVLICLDCDLDT